MYKIALAAIATLAIMNGVYADETVYTTQDHAGHQPAPAPSKPTKPPAPAPAPVDPAPAPPKINKKFIKRELITVDNIDSQGNTIILSSNGASAPINNLSRFLGRLDMDNAIDNAIANPSGHGVKHINGGLHKSADLD